MKHGGISAAGVLLCSCYCISWNVFVQVHVHVKQPSVDGVLSVRACQLSG
jgi:hypothetical protein